MKYVLVAVMFAAGLLIIGANLSVDAAKSSGTKNQQFGKTAQIQVCGTHFCESDPSLKKHVDHDKNKPTQDDLNAIFNRMDKIHKQHQDQLLDMWRLMTNAERVQFVKQINQMLEYMESMDMSEHMSMMSHDKMMGDDGMKKHGKMQHDSEMEYDSEEYDSDEHDSEMKHDSKN